MRRFSCSYLVDNLIGNLLGSLGHSFDNLFTTLDFLPTFLILFTLIGWGKCLLAANMLIKKSCTRAKLVPFVLYAMGMVMLFSAGCRKEKEPEIPASSPASYMNDPVFRKQLEEKRKELQAIVKARKPLADRMQQLVKEHGENLAALQKIPEWNDLHKKVVTLNAKYQEVRARQLKVVRERIAPNKEISK